MNQALVNAYIPLVGWTGLGLGLVWLLPHQVPRWLGRSLYWVGVPIEIFSLARHLNLGTDVGITPVVTVCALLVGATLAWLTWQGWQGWQRHRATSVPLSSEPRIVAALPRTSQGSFILSSMLGNTGFVGLAIAPILVPAPYLSWLVFYSITHNVLGTYGLGVLCASYYGRSTYGPNRWQLLRDVLTVPSLWAFTLGIATQRIPLPTQVETGLEQAVWIVIPCALVLMGMRLSQVRGWDSVQLAIAPTVIKVLLTPALIGLGLSLLAIAPPVRFALVLMSGMPSAFANLILTEEYDLDRNLAASSVALLLTLPLWVLWFPF